MNRTKSILLLLCSFLFILVIQATDLMGMGANPQQGQGGDACGTACGSFLFIIVAIFVLNIAILVWVAKDAKNRGMGSPVGWMFLVFFTGIIGLIIYLFSRVSGELVCCEVCRNKKLKVANVCPHCGNPSRSVETKPVYTGRTEYCPSCGHKVTPGAAFCEECGNKIEKT